jgi:hypothetical protein
VDSQPGATFNWKFENTCLKIDNENIDPGDVNHFSNMVLNEDPLFRDVQNRDYRLSESSTSRDKGGVAVVNESPAIPTDLLGNNRLGDTAPDCGAMEFTP